MRFFVTLFFGVLLALLPVHVGTSLIAGVPVIASVADMVGISEAKAQVYQGGSFEPGLVPWRGRTSLGPWGVQRSSGPQQMHRGGPVFYHRSPPQQHWGGYDGGFRPPMQQGFQSGGYGGQQQGGFRREFHTRREWSRSGTIRVWHAPQVVQQPVREVIREVPVPVIRHARPVRHRHVRRYYRPQRHYVRRAPQCQTCCCQAPVVAQPAGQQCAPQVAASAVPSAPQEVIGPAPDPNVAPPIPVGAEAIVTDGVVFIPRSQ